MSSPRLGGKIVLALWLCLAVWIGVDLYYARERERQNAEKVAGTLARVLESHLQTTLQKIDLRFSEFIDVHRDAILRRSPRSAMETQLAEYLALFPEVQGFRIADRDGNFVYDTSGSHYEINIAELPFFRQLRDGTVTGVAVSGPMRSRLTKEWVVILARRIDDEDGRFAGIMVAAVRADYFESLFRRLEIGRQDAVGLWSSQLQLVARWPRQEPWLGRKLEGAPILERLAAGEKTGSYLRASQIDNMRRLIAFRQVEGLPFIITVALAEQDYLAEWRKRALFSGGLSALLALALLALARSWARSHASAEELAARMTEACRAKEEEGRALIDAIPAPAWLVDSEGRILAINEAFARPVGKPMAELIGKSADDLFPPEIAARLREGQLRVYREAGPVREEIWLEGSSGRYLYDFVRVPVWDAEGKPRGIAGVAWDITQRVEAEQRQRLVTQVLDNSNEGLLILDAQHKIVLCNRAYERMLGYASAELAGRDPMLLAGERYDTDLDARAREEVAVHGDWRGETWLRTRAGTEIPVWCNVSTVLDDEGKPQSYIIQVADLSERRAAEDRIEALATIDQMTGLPNRYGFIRVLDNWLSAGRSGALLIFDLDHLGRVNDAFGHEAGDNLLHATGQRLRRLLREGDVLGRLGGDQFGVLVTGRVDAVAIEVIVRKLLDAIAQPLTIDLSQVVSTACAGVCLFPGDGVDSATLLRNADAAMHRAKATGANNYRFFSLNMNQEMAERLRLESDLRGALDRRELQLHYQPQYDLASGRLVGVECLLRWRHPDLGNVPPNHFIPLAEESRLILPIGRWVMLEACRQNRAWQEAGLAPWVVAVNLSAVQLHDGSIVEQVRESLALSGLQPCCLELEITESVVMQDPEHVAAVLGRLKALGVRLSIDDFGTGYSSLAYLKRFPLDKIKIDRSFVTDLERDPNDAAIVRMVIGIAKELELKVIAEGVETAGQRDFLHSHACDEAQGYLFSRPVPPEDIQALAAAGPPAPA